MVRIRKATLADIPEIAACDLVCFPKDDPGLYLPFFKNSILSPLEVVYVAEYGGRIVGYVVSVMLETKTEEEDKKEEAAASEEDKKEEEAAEEDKKEEAAAAEEDKKEEAGAAAEEDIDGYIDFLGVHPTFRKLGIAAKLMDAAHNALVSEYGCHCVFLHVRASNYAAINLYIKVLGYKFHYTEAEFYKDGEDAYVMRKQLPGKQPAHCVLGFSHGGGCFWSESNAELLGLLDRLEIC